MGESDEITKEYLESLAEEVAFALAEIQREKPSVKGKIMGMDFQQFSLINIFTILFDFEDYIIYDTEAQDPYGVLEWEIAKYSELRKASESVFSNFEELYAEMRNREGRNSSPVFSNDGSPILNGV